jgi:hypothetical protein
MRNHCARLLAALLALAGAAHAESPARVYTNDDLDRIAPRRGETGVLSEPAAPAPSSKRDGAAGEKAASGGEEHWRREADRVRERLQPLRDQAADLREQIAERSRTRGVKPVIDPKLLALEKRLRGVEDRIRDAELRFEERARRARALPGWLR